MYLTEIYFCFSSIQFACFKLGKFTEIKDWTTKIYKYMEMYNKISSVLLTKSKSDSAVTIKDINFTECQGFD